MNLYDIAHNIRALADMAQYDDFDEQTIADTLEALEGSLDVKADNIGKLVKMLERQADACELEAIRLKDRAEKLRDRAASVTNYLQAAMELMGVKKLDTDLFTVSIKGIPPHIEVDEELLPKEWLVERVSTRPDKIGIKAAIQAGQEIRGCKLVNGKKRLYIK